MNKLTKELIQDRMQKLGLTTVKIMAGEPARKKLKALNSEYDDIDLTKERIKVVGTVLWVVKYDFW